MEEPPEWITYNPGYKVTYAVADQTRGYVYARADLLPNVKPLEWRDFCFCGQPAAYAETEFGDWMVVKYTGRDGNWAYCDSTGADSDDDWATRTECEAAAQADYTARILAALVPQ